MLRIAALIAALITLVTLAPAASRAQETGWGDLDTLLVGLSPTGTMEQSWFLPDTADPATATRALGVVYAYIPGSAGSVSIHAAIYQRAGFGWAVIAAVDGLFGQSPRDAVFLPDRIEVTTTMPGPNDPRCCPTLAVRWSVDVWTGTTTRLN